MSFSASKSATAARASIRAEKYKKEKEEALQKELEAKAKDEKYRQAMMAAALRYLTPREMKVLGIEIITVPEDPNATPRSPNYARPTTASVRHRVAKGGRRTRKRRNGKKKTMRKGGRMRKGGMRRRHSSRNKRGGSDIVEDIELNIFDNEKFVDEGGKKVFRYYLNDERDIRVSKNQYKEEILMTLQNKRDINGKIAYGNISGKITKMTLTIPEDESQDCTLTVIINAYLGVTQKLIIPRKVANDLLTKSRAAAPAAAAAESMQPNPVKQMTDPPISDDESQTYEA
jgi:hypothetical protein